jgi:hypothetical protein
MESMELLRGFCGVHGASPWIPWSPWSFSAENVESMGLRDPWLPLPAHDFDLDD